MTDAYVTVRCDEVLRLFLAPKRRHGDVRMRYDGTSTLGHVVQSIGVPLPEVGRLLVRGVAVDASHRLYDGDVVMVDAVCRPQQMPNEEQRFLLDVHLGSLARRLRLLGVDTRYEADADDDALVERALGDDRVLLTKDRGLLCRRALRDRSAYVRGDGAKAQMADLLDRFAPPLRPFTRCLVCNAALEDVPKSEVEPRLEPGTSRSYQRFARCRGCGRVYWRGAHAHRLDEVVEAALHSAVHSRRTAR